MIQSLFAVLDTHELEIDKERIEFQLAQQQFYHASMCHDLALFKKRAEMTMDHRHQLEIHIGNPATRQEFLNQAAIHDLPKHLLEETVQVLTERLKLQEEYVALEATQKDKLEKIAEEQRTFQAEVEASQERFKQSLSDSYPQGHANDFPGTKSVNHKFHHQESIDKFDKIMEDTRVKQLQEQASITENQHPLKNQTSRTPTTTQTSHPHLKSLSYNTNFIKRYNPTPVQPHRQPTDTRPNHHNRGYTF